jgi:hypothetical protein
MTTKTRTFVLAALALLVVGLAGGLIAYLVQNRGPAIPAGLPPEVKFVPADAELVAFADVRAVMSSELRKQLVPTLESGSRKGRQMMSEMTGVDVEKQVNRVLVYLERYTPPDPQVQTRPEIPRALMLVQGTFDEARIEQMMRDRDVAREDHKGRPVAVHRENGHELGVGLVAADLIAVGQLDLVRRAIDLSQAPLDSVRNIMANADMMKLIRDSSGSTAWVVGQFDAVSRRMKLPPSVSGQVPPVRYVAAKASLNGGMKATIRAEAGDKAAADQLRDVVRGFVSLARLQAGERPGLDSALKSIELSGSDTTVQMSFAVAPETLRALTPNPPSR